MSTTTLSCRSPASWAPLPGLALTAAAALLFALPASASTEILTPCRIKGIEREVRCGTLQVPEDPDRPDGRKIPIHFAVVPALAKNKAPDPLFVLAGGPGQAATRVAMLMQPTLTRLNARRDIIYIDQRGTGRSNALACERGRMPRRLAESTDPTRAVEQLDACVKQAAERADTRQYATWIAVRDFDAVRAAIGAERINLWGGSYGTRAALEYLRQYPQRVRSVVLDGVAPAAMALPASLALDAERALQALVEACAADTGCRTHYPQLEADLTQVLAQAARGVRVSASHPLTGESETLKLDRTVLAGMLRSPLYAPQLASLLPFALAQAGRGNYDPLFAMSAAFGGRMAENFAELMHFAVVCAEDMPRIDAAARDAAAATRFGTGFIELYERACSQVPVRAVPPAFYTAPSADVPVLVLSGGADPVTPPRHGDAIATTLPRALHLVAPHLGHGVSQHGCAPDLIARFVRQADGAGRAPFDGLEGGTQGGKDGGKNAEPACLQRLPAPPAFRPPAFITP